MRMYEKSMIDGQEYIEEHWYTHNLSEEEFGTRDSCIEVLKKLRNNVLIKDDCIILHLKFSQDYPGRGEEHDYVAEWEEPWKRAEVNDDGKLQFYSYY